MDPLEAWALMDELTSHDSTYDIPLNVPNKTRGIYEVSDEVERDVRAQYQADEANRLKKQVSSLKACQLCQSSTHIASSCPNMKHVQAIGGYTEEKVHFSKDVYRNPNTSY